MATNMSTVTSGTGEGLVEFLTWAGNKGNLNKNTAGAFRAAAREVLGVDADEGDLSKIDIRTLDVDDLARRFANLRAGKYASGSLETYQSRFRRSVGMYKQFLENPAAWRPDKRERGDIGRKPAGRSTAIRKDTTEMGPTRTSTNFVVYPFPVRQGVLASLSLPADLTRAEAKRLGDFLQTLAVEETRLLSEGRRENSDDQHKP